ncbi:MAG: hypothetical protein MUF58_18115 [Arcicella sp.]|jgi:hypothetical protein|nr:hypothetical protein [Arcicella sp.]
MAKHLTAKKLCLSSAQAKAFLERIIELNLVTISSQFQNLNDVDWTSFGKSNKKINLVTNESIFYQIFNEMDKRPNMINEISLKSIKPFLDLHFPELNENSTDTTYGTIMTVGEIVRDDVEQVNEDEIIEETYIELSKHDWLLYTFGEKSIDMGVDSLGKKITKRIYYVKERPVCFVKDAFKKNKIIIKNSDDVIHKVQFNYQGEYEVFVKNKNKQRLLYLETDALEGSVHRHLRLIISFGKNVDEIGLGSFSGIRDGGAIFSGAALLVKQPKGKFRDASSVFYHSFVEQPLATATRMMFERRSRAFIKLPRHLKHYTLVALKDYFIGQTKDERKHWESREVQINRMDAYISIPLFYHSQENIFENNRAMLVGTIGLLKNRFAFKQVTHGIVKYLSTDFENIPQTDSGIFESNFDHITQSEFFILILPEIDFVPTTENPSTKLSTAFLELGFAWGIRKKIIIICTSESEKIIPNSIKEFKGQYVKIITGSFQNFEELEHIFNLNNTQLEAFFSDKSSFLG